MSKPSIYESEIEKMAIEELGLLGYQYAEGPDLAPDGATPERGDFSEVLLFKRLAAAVRRLNPNLPEGAVAEAVKVVRNIGTGNTVFDNEVFHKLLIDGVPVEYRKNGEIKNDYARLIEFDPEKVKDNDFLCVNQFTIIENHKNKRPDILIFVNGMPLVLFELKNPADENATVRKAYDQIGTYKATIPSLFTYNEINIISDGLEAKAGSLTAGFSRYSTWKTKDGLTEAGKFEDELTTIIHGLLSPNTLLDYIRNFITFEKTKVEDKVTKIVRVETVKKIAAYHQYYAVNKAVTSTVEAASGGNKKGGVVWHTQGSGKSLSMVFYAGKIIQALNNPTILVITDRNDLDDQLFDTFAGNSGLLRQIPVQADSTEGESPYALKKLLKVASGGVVFSTIQKFSPDKEGATATFERLSERENIIVIADEAHRTQYGFKARLQDVKDENKEVIGKRTVYGFAQYVRDALPHATFIGFTGTPIEKKDANTSAVFGEYVDIYDIASAESDKITVKIYYESRLAKVNLTEEGKLLINEFDKGIIEDDGEQSEAQKAKIKWAKLEAIVGNIERMKALAKDIVTHYEKRQEVFNGKAMIVCMSRRIAALLYKEIVALRPSWHSDDLDKGTIKVVMTSTSADGAEIAKHHTTKGERKALAERIKDESDSLKIVIVRDMWLTGFDAPCLNTMYVDKPMKEHNLMQAIARVNRVFKDKPGGLIVDYIGIATNLKKALQFYAESGGKGVPADMQDKAVHVMVEKLGVVRDILNGHKYKEFFDADIREKLSIILQTEDFILKSANVKERYLREVGLLGQAYALAVPDPIALTSAEEIAFFQAVKARLTKFERGASDGSDYESVIRNIIDSSIKSDEVIDIFDAAGLAKPEISVLSEEFLSEIAGMKYKNVAIELLKKILADEIRITNKHNMTQAKTLMEMLDNAVKKYQNNLLTTAEIIAELLEVAKKIREAKERGDKMGLSNDELAFYDALETNDSAVKILGDDILRTIARELAGKIRSSATIDWTIKESARAQIMVYVRRILTKYGYPPDKKEKAIQTVLEQAKSLADFWTEDK